METLLEFASYATAIVFEAAPFLLLGALLGSLVEVCVPDTVLQRLVPRSPGGQISFGLLAGLVVPTCECGVVPIARKLLVRGVPPRVVIPYMLAAPVMHPVSLLSTLVAFPGQWYMALWRVILVAVPAVALGLALGEARPEDVLRAARPALGRMPAPGAPAAAHDDHGHGPACSCGCGHDHGPAGGSKILRVLLHTAEEFLSMGRFLVLGACAAAAFKAFLPLGAIAWLGDNVFVAVPGMMLLAVLLSVCSEADAFVAASFAMVPKAAQLAFLALGPMVDLKLIPMFLVTFRRRLAVALVTVPTVVVLLLALALGLAEGR
jgi:hypothetical protein